VTIMRRPVRCSNISKRLVAPHETRARRRDWHNRRHHAFTLIELIVCVAIIMVLIALLLPAVQAIRDASRRTQCKNNLFQLGVGLHNYHDVHRTFPPGYVSTVGSSGEDLALGWGWAAMILPFVEHSTLWREIPFDLTAGSPACSTVAASRMKLFVCPSDWGARSTADSYVACFGRGAIGNALDRSDGVFFRNSRIRLCDIDDGALTILVGERSGRVGMSDWAGVFDEAVFISRQSTKSKAMTSTPSRVLGHTGLATSAADSVDVAQGTVSVTAGEYHPARLADMNRTMVPGCSADFGGIHSTGSHFLFVDGAVRFLSIDVDSTVYAALATRAGRELVNGTDF